MPSYVVDGVTFSIIPSLGISGVTDNRADYVGSNIPTWSKLEVTFDVDGSAATNKFLPYDAVAPPGIDDGIGISAQVEFSDTGFASYDTMPAFWAEDWQTLRTTHDYISITRDWYYPNDQGVWTARYSPPRTGSWQYRVRVTDASGTTLSDPVSFTVVASAAKGIVKVSETDARYFEYGDGSYFPALGMNLPFKDILGWDNPHQPGKAIDILQDFGDNEVTLLRLWFTLWGVYSAVVDPWEDIGHTDTDEPLALSGTVAGYAPETGQEAAFALSGGVVDGVFLNLYKQTPACKASTTYRLRIRYQIPSALSPETVGQPYGIVALKSQFWVDTPYLYSAGGTLLAGPENASTGADWETLEATFTTGASEWFLGFFYVTLRNVASPGMAFIQSVEVQESLGGGEYGPNIIPRPDADMHVSIDQQRSAIMDDTLAYAEANGVTFQMVLGSNKDWLLMHFKDDGTIDTTSDWLDSRYYYGSGATVGKSRWLQRAWWRYCQARWGYSSAIHSWELLNEGDPYNTDHFELLEDMSTQMHQWGNDHPCTTSTWHSMIRYAWNDAPSSDVVQLHEYVRQNWETDNLSRSDLLPPDPGLHPTYYSTGGPETWKDMVESSLIPFQTVGTNEAQGLGKPVVRGEIGLYVGSGFGLYNWTTNGDPDDLWLHHWVWSHIDHLGGINLWWATEHIYKSDGTPNLLPALLLYQTFMDGIPLSNGLYANLAATTSHVDIVAHGQKDTTNRKLHAWIRHASDTWHNRYLGGSVTPRSGTVTVPGMGTGTYTVTWVDPYTGATVDVDQVATAAGVLTLTLPSSLSTDIAVHAELSAGGGPMPGAKSNYLENELLDHVLGGGDYTRVATVYLGLFTDNPSDAGGGTEVSGGSYARKAVTNNNTNFPAASGGGKALAVQTDFVEATGNWGTITAVGIFDASTAGNLLYWATLTAPVTINTGEIARFAADALTFTED
jgi:hypothetical protein